jgi:hypothetical protein
MAHLSVPFLHKDLGLIKKNGRWVPKMLSKEQTEKKVEVETSAAFFKMILTRRGAS